MVSKYKEPLQVDRPNVKAVQVADSEYPVFTLHFGAQEVACMLSKETGEVVEGNPTNIESCTYAVEVTVNPDPDIARFGHSYMFTALQKISVQKQLV